MAELSIAISGRTPADCTSSVLEGLAEVDPDIAAGSYSQSGWS